MDWGFAGRFALRRSIRLDPPYWAAIALTIIATAVSSALRSEPVVFPSGANLVAHLLYLQTLLRFEQINSVFWTLTYEIQFYLVLVACLSLAQRAGPHLVLAAMFLPLLLYGTGLIPETVPGLFLNLWHTFFMGVLSYLGIKNGRAALGAVALASALLLSGPSSFTASAVITALALLAAGRTGWLQEGLGWRTLQGLGTISYSLYLTHNPVTGASFYALYTLGASEWLALPLVIAICIAVACAFWWALERPSQNFAKLIPLKPKPKMVAESAL